MKLIDSSRPLDEVYTTLLLRQKAITVLMDSKTGRCVRCSNPESAHLADGHCSTSILSAEYASPWESELTAINDALVVIEKLKEIEY